jgi:hypothetical protein
MPLMATMTLFHTFLGHKHEGISFTLTSLVTAGRSRLPGDRTILENKAMALQCVK